METIKQEPTNGAVTPTQSKADDIAKKVIDFSKAALVVATIIKSIFSLFKKTK